MTAVELDYLQMAQLSLNLARQAHPKDQMGLLVEAVGHLLTYQQAAREKINILVEEQGKLWLRQHSHENLLSSRDTEQVTTDWEPRAEQPIEAATPPSSRLGLVGTKNFPAEPVFGSVCWHQYSRQVVTNAWSQEIFPTQEKPVFLETIQLTCLDCGVSRLFELIRVLGADTITSTSANKDSDYSAVRTGGSQAERVIEPRDIF